DHKDVSLEILKEELMFSLVSSVFHNRTPMDAIFAQTVSDSAFIPDLLNFVLCQGSVSDVHHVSVNPSRTLERTREPYLGTITTVGLGTAYPDPRAIPLQYECMPGQRKVATENSMRQTFFFMLFFS
ncbi:hypothetical protein XENOCAPTIV_017758, partial [Xenoophorus captivus]